MSCFSFIRSVVFICGLLLPLFLTNHSPVSAEEGHTSDSTHENKHKPKHHQQHNTEQHGGGHGAGHGGGHHGGHGAIAKGIENFPTSAYTDAKLARDIQSPATPKMQGDPVKGKHLAASNKGRCLSCHILDADGTQAGNVGPNLSNYAQQGRSSEYTFQQIWDARAHNPNTLMPPLGTNELLTKHQVMHIVAYLETLNKALPEPQRPRLDSPNYYVAGEDLTLADEYIEQGALLFNKPGKNGKSCASCHAPGVNTPAAPGLQEIAANYPRYDRKLDKIMLIETRNNHCRKKYMHSHAYKPGSRHSNVLASYVKYLARNKPIHISSDKETQKARLQGKKIFYKKTGQLNLSCADCHDSAANKWLRGQPLSSIKLGGEFSYTAATWPKHYFALHDLGLISMQQRIRHCQIVTRTYPLKLGSDEYTHLELFITSLAEGRPMQAPTKSKPRGAD